ncbi:MAG: hypothetical protein JWM98_8 [Thermoleophilia bacterium]|nr:hypothetical protein [Thermoleophilia bacterium]
MQTLRTHILRGTRRAAACALLALAVLVPAASAEPATGSDSVGFGVAPLRFDVDATPGQSSTHSITITNTDEVATRYTFTKVDYQGNKTEPEATPQLLAGKFTSDISGYDWLGLPDPITIAPGESRTVDIRVTAPSGATGGHYAAVIVNGMTKSADQVLTSSGIGVLFLMNAGGVPPPDIVITQTQVVGPTRTVTEYINKGKTETTPVAIIHRRDPVLDRKIKDIKGRCTTALPGGSGKCTFNTGSSGDSPGSTVSDSPLGFSKDYVEVGDPRGSKSERARGELPTEWAGTWTSMLLPFVGVALFVLYFLFLRRRRKDEEEDLDGDGLAFDGPAF